MPATQCYRRAVDRYHRQTLLPGIGAEGQQRLRDSHVLLLGCGALGSVAADMLARAGVGHLTIVDRDFVEITNLQRQVLFDEADVENRTPKAEAARAKLSRFNSDVEVTSIVDDISHRNIARLASGVDALVDGLDNFETRYLANDFAVKFGLPYFYGGAVGTSGMTMPILPHGSERWDDSQATPCFRCLFEEPPPAGTTPTCDTAGVLGPAVSIIANLQVAELIKYLTGNVDQMRRRLLQVDLWSNDIHELNVARAYDNGDCRACKHEEFDYLDGREGSTADVLCGRDAVQLRPRSAGESLDFDELKHKLESHGRVRVNEFMLTAWITDDDTDYEITLFSNGRALVKGTQEAAEARSIYARYIGS